ncbi:MAG TPA: hypothetical protein VKE74_33455 [Gemmataceae bacterium]|nr:hypothetical protein [Gemmataceae bacterium]
MRNEKPAPAGTGKPGEVLSLAAKTAERTTTETRWSWPRFWEALRRSLGAVCC